MGRRKRDENTAPLTTVPRPSLDGIDAWVDLTSPAVPHLFGAIVDELDELSVRTTVRDKGATESLARNAGFDFEVVGRDPDRFVTRVPGVALRTLQLWKWASPVDVSVSFQNAMCVLASTARGIPSISFRDNDIGAHVDAPLVDRLYTRFEAQATYNVVPSAFETSELTDRGADPDSVYTYDGYKEDVYAAAFDPDPTFVARLPFAEYVVVRPEALTAAYVDADRSIVPELLEGAVERGFNVVYLPRGRNGDEAYGEKYPDDTVYVPPGAVDGRQLAWHARCVLTGSGTMAREAASMGKPAVSFFPARRLSVDRQLISEGRLFHSRDPAEIVSFLAGLDDDDVRPDRTHARGVHAEVCRLVARLIDDAAGASDAGSRTVRSEAGN